MANSNSPFGLRPIRHRNGAPYNGAVRPYLLPATDANDMFAGDPVNLAGNSNSAPVSVPGAGDFPPGTLPTIVRATAGSTNYLIGSIVEFAADADDLKLNYRKASTERVAWVADDPDLIFEIQEDGALAGSSVGQNVNLVAGAGSTVSGYSGWQIQSSSAGVGATIQLRLERLVNRVDNALGTNGKWLVAINLHSARRADGV